MSRPAADSPSPDSLSAPFPEATLAEWRARVERELGERDFAAELAGTLPGGLEVEPLYVERPWDGEVDPHGVAGEPPFVRGARPASAAAGWLRCASYELGPEPRAEQVDAAAAALREDLAGGCDAVLLSLASPGPLAKLLAAASLAETAIFLEDRGAGVAVAAALLDLLPADDSPRLGLGADPISALATTGGDAASSAADPALAELAARCRTERPRARALAASSIPIHEAGGHPSQELGWTLAVLAHTLRVCEAAGLAPADAAGQIELRMAMERDTFVGIAKLRALRSLWTRLLIACRVEEPPAPFVHAVSSARSLTRRGARLDLVRVTGQTLAAIAGGADAITAMPWDGGTAAGEPGSRSGRRLARNTQVILAQEAHLGRALDPAGGSYYVEHLTETLARSGWEELRRIEAAGGAVEYLTSGRLRTELDRSWEERAEVARRGELPIVGVTVYPDPAAEAGASAPADGTGAGADAVVLPRRRDEDAFAGGSS